MRNGTIREALLQASSLLEGEGVTDGRHEAQLLLLHLLGWDHSRLILDGQMTVFPHELTTRWCEMLARRCAGEPVQYIIGEQEFYGLPFEVNSAVLIPRPETELLVEAVVKRIRALWTVGGALNDHKSVVGVSADGVRLGYAGMLADIGTGSGAIAVTAASQLTDWQVAACDISMDALHMAERNAVRNGVIERMMFCQGDLLAPLLTTGQQVDVLVSNPPYIESGDIAGLQREVRDYEPVLALDGGADGLDFYRELVRQIGLLTAAPRLVGFEVGMGQAREVARMLEQAGWWSHYEIVNDYAGIERHVLAWRQ
jgi:release factor glutamine methyltransferase